MTKEWVNFQIGQRVEASDAIQSAVDTPVQGIQTIAQDLIVGSDEAVQSFVVSGFTISAPGTPTATVVQVTGGTAVVGYQRQGRTEFGMVLAARGSSSKVVDIASLADGTYGVYIRFAFNEERFSNRFFWNPLALEPVETPRNVGTRLVEDWSFTLDVVSPGPEWLQVGNVAKAGTVLTPTQDTDYLFDTTTGTIQDTEFAATDRSAPAGSLRKALMGLMRQIQDGFGLTAWRQAPPPGGALMRDGSRTVTGNLLPDATANERRLGSSGRAFDHIYTESITFVSNNLPSASQSPRLLDGVDIATLGQATLGPPNPGLDASALITLDIVGTTTSNPLARIRNAVGAAVSRIQIGGGTNTEITTLIHTPNAYTAPGATFDAPILEMRIGSNSAPGRLLAACGEAAFTGEVVVDNDVTARDYSFSIPKRINAFISGMNYMYGTGTLTQSGRAVGIGQNSTVTYDLSPFIPAGASLIFIQAQTLTGTGVTAFDLRIDDGLRGTSLGITWFNGNVSVIRLGNQSCTLTVSTDGSAANVFLSGLIIFYEISEVAGRPTPSSTS